jgi:branched-chain amino acid transport system ATP-binding protein
LEADVGAPGPAVEAILRLSNIEAAYGPITAIRGVSLAVPRGAIVAVLGANGAGKTTIMKAISGILDPTKGRIEFDGESIHGLEPDAIVRRGICHVPEGREIFPLLTVHENLMMGAYTRRDTDGIAADLEQAFTYFPILKERARQPAGWLSGGQQQMLAISRALMGRPNLLLLDEPSLGLSPRLTREIFEIVTRINCEQRISVMVVEQNAVMALTHAHFGYVLELGRVVMEDTCERLMKNEDIKEFYLGMQATSIRGERRWKRRKTWR